MKIKTIVPRKSPYTIENLRYTMVVFFRKYAKEAQYVLTRTEISVDNNKKLLCDYTVLDLYDKNEVKTVINIIVESFDKLSNNTGKLKGVGSLQVTHMATDEEGYEKFLNSFFPF